MNRVYPTSNEFSSIEVQKKWIHKILQESMSSFIPSKTNQFNISQLITQTSHAITFFFL